MLRLFTPAFFDDALYLRPSHILKVSLTSLTTDKLQEITEIMLEIVLLT